MSISGLFDIGRTTLLATQQAMNTVAHNVANAATPGYTRQQVSLQSVDAGLSVGSSASGRGVRIADIQRMYDSFTSLQVRTEQSNQSYWDTTQAGLTTVDNIFNESGTNGIGTSISDFFNGWQALSNAPQGSAERSQLVEQGANLAGRISSAYSDINTQRKELFQDSQTLTDKINGFTKQIAVLNQQLAASHNSPDLLDQRDNLVDSLNQLVKVNTFQDNTGGYTVMLGGIALVDGVTSHNISTSLDSANKMTINISLSSTETKDITANVAGGQLKANLDLRDSTLLNYGNKLNAFAVNLADTVNFYHRQGYGTDGSTGNNFFNFNNSLVNYTNPAVGSISRYNVTDVTAFGNNSNAQYKIDYLNAAGYTALPAATQAQYQQEGVSGVYWRVQQSADNWATQSAVSPANVTVTADTSTTPNSRTLAFNGISVGINGDQAALSTAASGTFTIQQNANAAMNFSEAITDPAKVAAAAGDTVMVDNSNNSFSYSTDGGNTFNTARIAAGTYTRQQLGAALQTALPGVAVAYNAGTHSYTVTNNNAGTLVLDGSGQATTAGGFFGFSSQANIVSGASATGSSVYPQLPGDNNNALIIADQANKLIMAGATPSDFYAQIVSAAGTDASNANTNSSYYTSLVEQLNAKKQATSGVSLDEEAVSLVKYQQMYQAAAKIVETVNALFSDLMSITGAA